MAPAEKTAHTIEITGGERRSSHSEGTHSGSSHSPVLGEDRDRAAGRSNAGRMSFAGAGGWVVTV